MEFYRCTCTSLMLLLFLYLLTDEVVNLAVQRVTSVAVAVAIVVANTTRTKYG